jgi:hypothetical protein
MVSTSAAPFAITNDGFLRNVSGPDDHRRQRELDDRRFDRWPGDATGPFAAFAPGSDFPTNGLPAAAM